jgi:Ca2+-binding EF-hand superfamily protein
MFALIPFMLAGSLLGTGLAIAQSQVAQSQADVAQQRRPVGYLAKFDEQFKSADKDGDGALSKAEAENAGMDRVVANFDKLDIDKDGKVTRNEIRALVRQRLSS